MLGLHKYGEWSPAMPVASKRGKEVSRLGTALAQHNLIKKEANPFNFVQHLDLQHKS